MLDIQQNSIRWEYKSPKCQKICRDYDNGESPNSQKIQSTLCDSQDYQSSLPQQSRVINNKSKLSLSFSSSKTNSFSEKEKKVRKHHCGQHDRKYTYSCMNCETHSCGACLLNSSQVHLSIQKHRNHRFKCYNSKRQDLLQVEAQLSARISFRINQIRLCVSNFNKLLQLKQAKQFYSLTKMEENLSQVEQQRQTKINQYEMKKQVFYKTLIQFNNFYQLRLNELKNTNKVSFLKSMDSKYESKLSEGIKQVKFINLQKKFIQRGFKEMHKPQPYTYNFQVSNFSLLYKQQTYAIGDPFECFQSLWRLKVYPAGYGESKIKNQQRGVPYISIYIERIDGVMNKGQYNIQVQIISQTDQRLKVSKDFKSEFEKNESWGYDKYTRLSNIYQYGFLGNNDTLSIKVMISPTSYYEACKPLNQLIHQKEKKQYQNQNKIKILKFRLEQKKKHAAILQAKISNMHNQFHKIQQEFKVEIRMLNLTNNQKKQQHENINYFQDLSNKKQEIRTRIGERGALDITRGREIFNFSSISLEKRTPCNLIRLVSLQNSELIENSKKKFSSRCNTLY